jgi:hypothetical protein
VSPATSADNAAIYAEIESEVETIRGLRPRSVVDPKVVDQAQMSKIVSDELASTPASVQQANERMLKALGLLPESASLQSLYLQLLQSQVAGLYDPQAKTLYVLSKAGGLGPVEKVTFAHEFDHALQDQNFGLQKLAVDQIGEGDQDLAHLSVAEGDATLLMSLWAGQHLSPAETLQLLAASNDPQQLQVLQSMPAILRETLLFPYTTGLQFITGLETSGGWAAVNAAYARPPASTEQLLHPGKYASHEGVLPVSVPGDLRPRLGTGWSVPLVDSLGEFQLRIWLRVVGGLPESQADAAAAGWGGDRIVLAEGPNGAWAVALLTRWDSPTDADEFQGSAFDAARALQLAGKSVDVRMTTPDSVAILVAADHAGLVHLATALRIPD